KTLIRTPISGTLTALTVEEGDIVSPLEEVGQVNNTGNLEVSVYVSSDDAELFRTGMTALVNGNVSGTIIEVAPTLDPVTQKREVVIRAGSSAELTTGEVVSVRFEG